MSSQRIVLEKYEDCLYVKGSDGSLIATNSAYARAVHPDECMFVDMWLG